MLGAGSLVLFMANRITGKIEEKAGAFRSRPVLRTVNEVVDTLLERHRIDLSWMKSWSVFTPDRRFIREERRIQVPARFISLDFNHDLSRKLAQYDLAVVATERTKESAVVMHVIDRGMVIQSLKFVLNRDLE
jgi:hypothetical protein